MKKKTNRKNGSKRRGAAPSTASDLPASDSPMDVRLLEKMVRLMSANDLSVVDVRDGEKRVILKRGAAEAFSAGPAAASPRSLPASVPTAPPPAEAAEIDANLVPIKSPMVGTFYSAPSPDAPPFVGVGDTVTEETDVCVIEAMKVFNNIRAEVNGVIAKILVQNGQTVEFGQPLFLVRTG